MLSQPQSNSRLGYIDNLRSTMIVWVVAFHTAITYSHIGSWYYCDPKPVGKVSSIIFLTFEVHSQAFFMGILFLLAGYFVPGSFDRKGFRRFMPTDSCGLACRRCYTSSGFNHFSCTTCCKLARTV